MGQLTDIQLWLDIVISYVHRETVAAAHPVEKCKFSSRETKGRGK